jgi:hypothetical protein
MAKVVTKPKDWIRHCQTTSHRCLTTPLPQVAIQHVSDTENQNPSPLSTPARSLRLAVLPEGVVPDDTSPTKDSQPTLAQPTLQL